VEERKRVYDELRSKGIFTQVHYIPVHYMPYYQQLGYKRGDYPIAEAYYERALSLPMYPTLSEAQQEFVIEQINRLTLES
jgi:dTDP-4-amino-4,6-dideoxygalactose transaminase